MSLGQIRRRGVLAGCVLLAVGLGLGACSGGRGPEATRPDPSGSSASDATPRSLSAAWTTPSSFYDIPDVATTDLLVFDDGDTVTTLDRATGEEVSHWSPSADGGGRICATSPHLGRGRMLGVLVQTKGHRCTIATAVDVRTGKAAWRVSLVSDSPDLKPGERDPYFEGESIDVSDRTLLATMFCDGVRRLRLSTGRQLSTIAPTDLACRNQTVVDGSDVAVLDYDLSPTEYHDPSGSGFFPAEDGVGGFELVDGDTGRVRWTHPVAHHTSAAVSQLLSVDPTVLTTAAQGRTTTRLWSADGGPGPFLGKATPFPLTHAQAQIDVVGRTDDVLVLRYPHSPDPALLHGFDLTTGAQRWQLLPPGAATETYGDADAGLATVDGDRLVVALQRDDGVDLLGYDATEPGPPELLGRAKGRAVDLDGDLLLTAGDRTSAYVVPTSGAQVDYRVPGASGWTADDIHPADAVEACEAVTPATLRLARLDWGDLPAPSDCTWRRDSDNQPDYLRRGLSVKVEVGVPTSDETADAAAGEIVRMERRYVPDGTPPLAAVADGHQLGDQTWTSLDSKGVGVSGTAAQMVTRWRNVVVTVQADQDVALPDLASGAIPVDRLQDVAYAATADVLGPLGAPSSLPARGAAGPTAAVGTPCSAVGPVATDLLPVTLTGRGRSGEQQQTCVWTAGGGENASEVVLTADVVPGALDGTSAADQAARVAQIAAPTRAPAGPIDGLPGQSTLRHFALDEGGEQVWTAVSRVDDLVVSITYDSDGQGDSVADMRAGIRRLMRAAVGAAH